MADYDLRRARRRRRHRDGLCRDCSTARVVGSLFCAPHREADRARALTRKRRLAGRAS